MSNNAATVVDAETQQFHKDLFQSIREFKAGNFAQVTKIETEVSYDTILVEPLEE